MKRGSLAVFSFLLCPLLSAIQWPVEGPELLYGFGSPLKEGISTGIGLKKTAGPVKVYDEGELIFLARENYGPEEEGSGVVVLNHDDGFRSCYGQIRPEGNLENRSYLKAEDILGTAGETVRFSIRDSELDRWVNPFFMFSVEEDLYNPAVESVVLEKNGQLYPLPESAIPGAGPYRLLVKISDRMDEGGATLLPYSIKIRYLGQVLFSLSLDSLVSREGKFYFEGNESVQSEELFTEDGYLDGGELVINQGKGLLVVELTDYRGNRTSRTYTLDRGGM